MSRLMARNVLVEVCPTCKEDKEAEGLGVAEEHGEHLEDEREKGRSSSPLSNSSDIPCVVPESGTNKDSRDLLKVIWDVTGKRTL